VLSGPSTGSVFSLELLADGSALIRAENGLFRLPAGADALQVVGGPPIGGLRSIEAGHPVDVG
jgi:hypothetical protein